MLFDNRWNQHTCTSLTLLPFGLWAPAATVEVKFDSETVQYPHGRFSLHAPSIVI